jgi:phage/plasmid-like protein (TIGR03299 family)
MAHELLIGDDGKAAMFYVDEMPWHGLGTALHQPPTAIEAIKFANLDWRVAKVPLFYHESIERVGVVPDAHAVIPTDGWHKKERPVFGVVSDKYEPLQNTEAFAFFDPLVEEGYATYETAGALGNGERVWVLAKLNNPIDIKGDLTDKYLLLSNSHNGKSAVKIKFTPIRVVCNNTLTWALSKNRNYNIKHDSQLELNIGKAKKLFSSITSEYADIEKTFRTLAETEVDEKRLDEYLNAVYPEPTKPEDTKRLPDWEKRVERSKRDRAHCVAIFQNAERQPVRELQNTLWTAYNAVTDYVDHYSGRTVNTDAHLNSIWFGSRSITKSNALQTATEYAESWKSDQKMTVTPYR